ncbi:MAG: DMT family transporter, partial [Bacteroidales bacterium]|nr:DMT family transporter [Bacteroidales bacterium]
MIAHLGEIISLAVAFMWTVTALSAEVGTKRLGVLNMNCWRLLVATVFTSILLIILTRHALPVYAKGRTWALMAASGFVGFFLGDFCLFNSYVHIGSRYGQLFMTLSPAAAAIMAWITLGQTLTWMNLLAMVVTLAGIIITILGRSDDGHHVSLSLPWKGVLYGIGAGTCQGVGLVLSKLGMDSY